MDMRVQLRGLLSEDSEDSDRYMFNLPNYTLAGVTNPLTTVTYVELGTPRSIHLPQLTVVGSSKLI